MFTAAILLPIAYLLGSIPFGLVFTRLKTGQDIRQAGSGNIGATNVLRSGGKGLAALTLLCDAAKAFAAVWLTQHYAEAGSILPYFAAVAALLGHIFPVWLKFKGGKGVASYLGVLLALHPLTFWLAVLSWVSTFALTRISSLAALLMLATSGTVLFIFQGMAALPFIAVALPVIFWAHRQNIRRLLKGEEEAFKRGG